MEQKKMIMTATSKGQIVLPIEMRREFGNANQFESADVEIFHPDAETFIIKAIKPHCRQCESRTDLLSVGGKWICRQCATALLDALISKKGDA